MDKSSIRWTVVTGLGLALGIAMGVLLQDPIEAVFGMILVTPIVTVLVGATLGTAQWLELRRRLGAAHRWLLATAVGLGGGLAVGVVAVEVIGEQILGHPVRLLASGPAAQAMSMLIVGFIAGSLLGLIQRAFVRSLGRRWPLASGLGLGLGLAVGSLLANAVAGTLTSLAGFIVLVLCAGFALGSFTTRAVRPGASEVSVV